MIKYFCDTVRHNITYMCRKRNKYHILATNANTARISCFTAYGAARHYQHSKLSASGIFMMSFLLLILAACNGHPHKTYSAEEKAEIDSIVQANSNADSLNLLAERFAQNGNAYGVTATYRELGKNYYKNSRFAEAIDTYKKGLQCAVKSCDTLQIIQALNNIGTSFRRMGILDEASSYHYKALSYCDAFSNKNSNAIRKCKVISLNGIGNVQLTLDNREAADSAFRMALAGERALGSALGQAINCANIGSIFEEKGQADSAKHYYQLSMQLNREAKSDLGVSLCHTHFGQLYENSNNLDSAAHEYRLAYNIMSRSSDTWHWLESCLALARVYIKKGDLHTASHYLNKAKSTATGIYSLEHLSEVYHLEYLLFSKRGDSRAALASFVRSKEYADSVLSDKNISHMQNVRIRYERDNKQNEINLIQKNYQNEKTIRQITLAAFVIVLILAIVIITFLWYVVKMRSRQQQIMKQAEQMRTNFFTNITHEFRTPLTVIQSAAQDIMRHLPEDSDLRHNASDIIRHGQGLLNLVNQMLDIAKIMTATKRQEPQWKHGDIVEFITILCESHKSYAASKGIELTYTPQHEHIEMDFNPDYMLKIIQNLISNAIKFSTPGGKALITTKQKGHSLQIFVSDEGIGMTAQQKENIFKPFYQASNDTHNIGTGIGLSLVKLAVENMKGKIEVHSAPGEGSVFIITLPMTKNAGATESLDVNEYAKPGAPDTAIAETSALPDDECTDSDAIRILIVEDTPEVARYISRQLNTAYNYYFATNGEEALQKAEQLVPDLIVTDIMMPGMDGFELCRRVRTSELLNHIPVVMVTAKATHEDRLHGLEVGADAYLEKPFHADELNLRVEKLLEQRSLLRKKYSQATAEGSEPDATLVSDASRAFLEKVTDAVQEEIKKGKIDYDALAYSLCLSRAQLNRKIKAITGLTTTDFILQIRISLAKKLLDMTDLPIWEVALKCGMDNDSYFCTLFKKSTGMTPLQYKSRKS